MKYSNSFFDKTNDLVGNFGKPILDIKGQPEVFERLTFVMGKFNVDQVFKIDFGDGMIKTIFHPYIHHQYQKKGEYALRILKITEEAELEIHTQNIHISEVSGARLLRKMVGL